MTWFWQQQINYDTNIGLTTVNKKTDWLSPNSANQDDLTQYNIGLTQFDEAAGSFNYSYLRYDNLYNTFPIWNDLDNIKTVDSNYTYFCSSRLSVYQAISCEIYSNSRLYPFEEMYEVLFYFQNR